MFWMKTKSPKRAASLGSPYRGGLRSLQKGVPRGASVPRSPGLGVWHGVTHVTAVVSVPLSQAGLGPRARWGVCLLREGLRFLCDSYRLAVRRALLCCASPSPTKLQILLARILGCIARREVQPGDDDVASQDVFSSVSGQRDRKWLWGCACGGRARCCPCSATRRRGGPWIRRG